MDINLILIGFLLLGTLAGLLAGLFGLGGGIIIIPGLVYLFGIGQVVPNASIMHLALGTSITAVAFTAFIGMVLHQKQKTINWLVVEKIVPGLLVGALIGPYLASRMPTPLLADIFATFLALVALRFIFEWQFGQMATFPRRRVLIPITVGMGALTSMLGLGGGVLLVPFLACLPLNMREVAGMSLVCILPVALVGMLGYIVGGIGVPGLPAGSTGYIYWSAVIPIIMMSAIFTPVGVQLAKHIPTRELKRFFGLVLLAVAAAIFVLK